jgi:hypothetical protein
MTSVDINPRNPFRPPDWRWKRALYLFEGQANPHSRCDDRWTRSAIRLIERLDAGGIPPGRRRTVTDGVLDDAHALKFSDDPRCRWEAEARILAGQEPAAIAAGLDVSPDSIEAFEALFFDVGDRLDAVDYLVAFAFGHDLYNGIAQDDFGSIVKVIGYNVGPIAVDALVRRWDWPSASRLAPLPVAELAAMQRSVDLLIAALGLSADGSDARTFKKLNRLAKDLNRSSSARLIAPLSTPAKVTLDPPLIADPTRRDDVSSSLATGSDILELATHRLSDRFEPSTANPPLAAAG